MGKEQLALAKAVASGDSDLVYLVLLFLHSKLDASTFLAVLKSSKEAYYLWRVYLERRQHPLQPNQALEELYSSLQKGTEFIEQRMRTRGLPLMKRSSKTPEDVEFLKKELNTALSVYKEFGNGFAAGVVSAQLSLLHHQVELQVELSDVSCIGLSLNDTIQLVLRKGKLKWANRLRSKFNVPDSRWWWAMITFLGQDRNWKELDHFANQKRSPIGYQPFAEVCIECGNTEEAGKYIMRVPDPVARCNLYMSIGRFKEAAGTAMETRNLPLLLEIRSMATNRDDLAYIAKAIAQVQQG
eukprot:TRINITY_DN9244_c0_g3_i1.p1 TRINITY_DN9244_c0_g3~~TRINITY_DN9244_c0_g3_i1.p1  ORF type:complete len:298 (+),score=56.49 TRINITY_DN9244_c0_g3_i1:401-1294(+)